MSPKVKAPRVKKNPVPSTLASSDSVVSRAVKFVLFLLAFKYVVIKYTLFYWASIDEIVLVINSDYQLILLQSKHYMVVTTVNVLLLGLF